MSKSQADSKSQSPTLGRHNIPWYIAAVSVLLVYTRYILFLSQKKRHFHKANYLLHVEKTTALLQFYFYYFIISSRFHSSFPQRLLKKKRTPKLKIDKYPQNII